MPKEDFPALLEPGLHRITTDRLFAVAVDAFPGNEKRESLYQSLSMWIASLGAAGVTGTLWLDGSFLTSKPEPSDIDIVLWHPRWRDPALDTPENRQQVELLLNHQRAKALWNLDVYPEAPSEENLMHREAYWRGLLGFCHDRQTAKGFAEVAI